MRNGDKITTGTCKLSHPVEIVGVQKQLKREKHIELFLAIASNLLRNLLDRNLVPVCHDELDRLRRQGVGGADHGQALTAVEA